MAHPKHEEVRQQFGYCCGYCGVSEIDAGGELTVDHYTPASAGGTDDLDNLVYACYRCNQYKSSYLPNERQAALQKRVLHPLRDDIGAHLHEHPETGELVWLTETGRFHVALLRLNRPALRAARLRRRIDALRIERERKLEEEGTELRRVLEVQEKRIAILLRLRQALQDADDTP